MRIKFQDFVAKAQGVVDAVGTFTASAADFDDKTAAEANATRLRQQAGDTMASNRQVLTSLVEDLKAAAGDLGTPDAGPTTPPPVPPPTGMPPGMGEWTTASHSAGPQAASSRPPQYYAQPPTGPANRLFFADQLGSLTRIRGWLLTRTNHESLPPILNLVAEALIDGVSEAEIVSELRRQVG